jgi:hypothetical protein
MKWIKITDENKPDPNIKIAFLTDNILFPDNAHFGIKGATGDYYSKGHCFEKGMVTHYFYVKPIEPVKEVVETQCPQCGATVNTASVDCCPLCGQVFQPVEINSIQDLMMYAFNDKDIAEYYTNAINELLQSRQQDGWISVEDRLPEGFELVLAYTKSGKFGVAIYDDELKRWGVPIGPYEEATHWHPLPNPPETKEG